MQLRFIRRHPSDLARLLLQEARRRGLTTTFALAGAIKVDPDSVTAVLDGGRPNARTVQRYRAFLRLSTEQVLQLKDNILPAQILALVQPKRRGYQRPPLIDATDFAQEIVELRQLMQGVVHQVAALGEEMKAVDQRVATVGDLADTLDGNPELREFLSASTEARRMAMQVLRMVTQRSGLTVAPVDSAAASTSAAAAAAIRKSRRIAKRA
jgi:hypothetical protein